MAESKGWGELPWGAGPWGAGISDGVAPPAIVAVDPEEGSSGIASSTHVSIGVSDEQEVNVDTLLLSVGGITYVRNGVAINGATITAAPNEQNGFTAQVDLPIDLEVGIFHDVNAMVVNISGIRTIKQYTFQVGVQPRLLQVKNPAKGILIAFFNQAMKHNADFLSAANWKVDPVSDGAIPLSITEVIANSTQPDQAILRYEGGGSTYKLTTFKLVSASGQQIEPGYESALFDILFKQDEKPKIRLFDTIFGVVGVSQGVISRRTMDDHVAGRAIATGMDEQFRLRMQTFDGAQGRTGKPGTRRT